MAALSRRMLSLLCSVWTSKDGRRCLFITARCSVFTGAGKQFWNLGQAKMEDAVCLSCSVLPVHVSYFVKFAVCAWKVSSMRVYTYMYQHLSRFRMNSIIIDLFGIFKSRNHACTLSFDEGAVRFHQAHTRALSRPSDSWNEQRQRSPGLDRLSWTYELRATGWVNSDLYTYRLLMY